MSRPIFEKSEIEWLYDYLKCAGALVRLGNDRDAFWAIRNAKTLCKRLMEKSKKDVI